ncbi:putative lipase ATG15-1 [Cercospora beticola]|uniref:triacylglycerol lipase n=2 Tax=Cercospora beticola TaxID=122368 RepID=A0A2G5I4B7_CERBT|nr:putative lipase ATG15-1 [Cercospora beticola]PIA99591.1 putative lipase ATG15-1 [Cercospora beticola]
MLFSWLLILVLLFTDPCSAVQYPLRLADGWKYDDSYPEPSVSRKGFTLRHVYHRGTHDYPSMHRYHDISIKLRVLETLPVVHAVPVHIERLVDRRQEYIDSLLATARSHGQAERLSPDAWTIAALLGPNTTDKSTVIALAKMAYDAYVPDPSSKEWKSIGPGNHSIFNHSSSFGWDSDGLRGHVFLDETNSTMVISLKGTSMALFDGEGSTRKDKLNDNLFASCCCGQGGHYGWKVVCDCMTSAFTCNNTCLASSLETKDHYYNAGRELYGNITARYPQISNVWLTGHSLGGVVASLLGMTYGVPVMTYEAFPDALAASRLGLPTPPGYHIGQSRFSDTGIYHYGHTADPVFMGTCNSLLSGCTLVGYAFQSMCHTGKTCIYDTVKDLGWRSSVSSHRIVSVISDVLEAYDQVPVCEVTSDCEDCFNWKFYESDGSENSTEEYLPRSTIRDLA